MYLQDHNAAIVVIAQSPYCVYLFHTPDHLHESLKQTPELGDVLINTLTRIFVGGQEVKNLSNEENISSAENHSII